jgi:hypothetical protein
MTPKQYINSKIHVYPKSWGELEYFMDEYLKAANLMQLPEAGEVKTFILDLAKARCSTLIKRAQRQYTIGLCDPVSKPEQLILIQKLQNIMAHLNELSKPEQPEATITKLVNTIGSKEKVKAYCDATSHSFESFSAGINYAIDRISTKFEWEELNQQPEAVKVEQIEMIIQDLIRIRPNIDLEEFDVTKKPDSLYCVEWGIKKGQWLEQGVLDRFIGKLKEHLVPQSELEQPEAVNLKPPHKIEGDFTEDFSHENGNYSNICKFCGNEFYGYKYRRVCKVCIKQLHQKPQQPDKWNEENQHAIAQSKADNYKPQQPKASRSMVIQCENMGYCLNYAKQCDLCEHNLFDNRTDWYYITSNKT